MLVLLPDIGNNKIIAMKTLVLLLVIMSLCINEDNTNSWYFFQVSSLDTVYYEVHKIDSILVIFNEITNSYIELSAFESNNFSREIVFKKLKNINNILCDSLYQLQKPKIILSNKLLNDFEYIEEFEYNFAFRATYHKDLLKGIKRLCVWDEYGRIKEIGYFNDNGLKDDVWIYFNELNEPYECVEYDNGKLVKKYPPPCYN